MLGSSNSRTHARIGLFARVGDRLAEITGARRLDAPTAAAIDRRYTVLGALAAADGIVTSHETDWVNALMDRDDLSVAARAVACAAFDAGRRTRGATDAAILALAGGAACGTGGIARLIDDMVVLAVADERLRPSEIAWMHRFAEALGVEPAFVDARLGRCQGTDVRGAAHA
jgi:uncharacterized tellurite resistance protein B-like protein